MAEAKANVSIHANVILHKEKIKPGAAFQKANCIDNLIAPREGVYCRCNPAPLEGTPRHSGRYPWEAVKQFHFPSPGYLFANLDHIRVNTSWIFEIDRNVIVYRFSDGQLSIVRVYPRDDLMLMVKSFEMEEEDFKEAAIREIAETYDDIKCKEVFKMTRSEIFDIHNLIADIGGELQIEQGPFGERAMATIRIPAEYLNRMQFRSPTPELLGKTFRFPDPSECIRDIQVFNNHAVEVTFADGTKTRSEVHRGDTFNLDTGIAYCLFKKKLGGGKEGQKAFNDLMRKARKVMAEQEEQKVKLQKLEEFTKRQAEKARKQREKRKAKKREEQIGIFQEALKRNLEDTFKNPMDYSVTVKELDEEFKPGVNPEKEDDKKVISDGRELFFEPLSGRTFTSSRDKILFTAVTLNDRILDHNWVSVNEWYEELGLDSTGELGESMGWNIDHMLNIDFASDITRDGQECLTVIYGNRPVGYGEGKA